MGASCLPLGCSPSGPIALWKCRSLSSSNPISRYLDVIDIWDVQGFFCEGLRLGKSDGLSAENT